VLTGLRLEVQRGRVEAAGRQTVPASEVAWSALDLGDLPAGRPIWIAGRCPRGESKELTFRVRTARQHEVASCRVLLGEEKASPIALKALFGARRIRGLEFLIHSARSLDELDEPLRHLGYDPAQVLAGLKAKGGKVYAENVREDLTTALRSFLVAESLDYGLACMETAFVAVRTEAGKPVEGTVLVANALPAGWADEFEMSARSASPMLRMGAVMGAAGAKKTMLAKQVLQEINAGGRVSKKTQLALDDAARELMGEMMSAPLAAPAAPPTPPPATGAVIYAGVPVLTDGEAVLFDSTQNQGVPLPEQATLTRLAVRFPAGAPADLDASLHLLIYVDDMASPRARVRLIDVVRQRGERPLNLLKLSQQAVRVVLTGAADLWKAGTAMEVSLAWQA
jgi:Ca-activated chloride channel family protein